MREDIYNKLKDVFEKNNNYARTQDIRYTTEITGIKTLINKYLEVLV